MAIAEISVVPIGTKTPSLSEHVAGVIRVLEEGRVNYELTSMGTIIEGDLEGILDLVGKMHEAAFGGEVSRVLTTVKIDDRRDKPLTREGKARSVKEILSRPHGD